MRSESDGENRNATTRKMFLTTCLLVVTLASANFTVNGQISFPRIPRPRQNPPARTTTPPVAPQPAETRTPSQAPHENARRQRAGQTGITAPPEGNYLDDGYTWFEAVSTQELNAQHRPVTTGWALDSQLRLVGDYPRRSAFKINVARAGKILATNRCEAYSYVKDAGRPGVNYIVTGACVDKTKTIKELGKFDVEVIAINGDTDAETPVRNYKIEVLKVERIGGGFSNPQPDAPHYYISRHAEAPVSFLFLRPNDADSYVPQDRRPQWNGLEIYYSLSPSEKGKANPQSYVQCSVDGKPLDLGGGRVGDELDSKTARGYEVVYSDRLAAAYKNGTEFRDDIAFRLVRVTLPFYWGNDRHGFSMSAHPGNWECSMLNNGEKWRTWRWTVGADGMPVRHAEQAGGNVKLYYNSYLLDMDIPAGGSVLDKRLVPVSAAEGFFYGQKWTTAEGRAMASRVQSKGIPAPLPSNKIKGTPGK